MWRPILPSSVRLTSPARSKRSGGVLLVLVRLEPVRSAEPPSISGSAAVKASSASCEALREATVSALACAATAASTATCAKFFGSSPFMRRVNSAASSGMRGAVGGEALVPVGFALRRPWPWRPSRRTPPCGSSKGSCGQPSAVAGQRRFRRRPAARRAPWRCWRGSGEPLPMCVLQTISVGLSALRRASAMARSTASTSWPSIGPITFQP